VLTDKAMARVAHQHSHPELLAEREETSAAQRPSLDKPHLALDSLDAARVSGLHILQGKLKTLQRLSDFQRDLDRLQEHTSQLALLRIREEELLQNIPEDKSRAENFSSVSDPEILDNISTVLSGKIDYRVRSIERKTHALRKNSPFDPGSKWSRSQMITDSFSKADAITLLDARLEASHTSSLVTAATLLRRNKPGTLAEAVNLFNTSVRHSSGIASSEALRDLEHQMRASIVRSEHDKAHAVFHQTLVEPLAEVLNASSTFNEMSMLSEYLTKVPQENLETMQYFFPSSPVIFTPEYLAYLRRSGQEDIANIQGASLRQNMEHHARRLWDVGIPWKHSPLMDTDVRLLATTYATIKRLSVLTSSLQAGLEEIELSADHESKREKRETLIDSYWELYHDTRHMILEEGKKAVISYLQNSGNSLNQDMLVSMLASDKTTEDLSQILTELALDGTIPVSGQLRTVIENNHTTPEKIHGFCKTLHRQATDSGQNLIESILAPYGRIIQRLDQIPRGSHSDLYKREEGDSDDPMNSSYLAFERSTRGVNSIVNSLARILDEAGASTDSVNAVLQKFVNENREHPNSAMIKDWARSFPVRFSILGVPWTSIR
jgi:hypothetical protein